MKLVFSTPVLFVLLCRTAAPQAANPILENTIPIPFDRIKAEQVLPAARQLLGDATKRHEAYLAASGALTFANTILALDEVTEGLDRAEAIAGHLAAVVSTPELRAAVAEALPMVTRFRSGISLDPRVWAKIEKYAATEEARSLTGNRKRLLELTLKQFRRNGADLDAAAQARLRDINVELANLSRQFADNLLQSRNAFELVIADEAKLAGLPQTARMLARQSAAQKGIEGWRFTLEEPSVQAVATYLDDASTREKVVRARVTTAAAGKFDNRPVIRRTLELRRERAQLLGYRDWADYQTELRMVGSGARVRDFLADLDAKTRAAFQREYEALVAHRRELEGESAPPLAIWDIQYYLEKLRKAKYELDTETLRPYFPLDGVLKGLFEITGKLYGVQFSKIEGAPVWNPAVEYFAARDSDGRLLGYFYTDFYARSNKGGGAWSNTLISRRAAPDRPAVEVIVGNLTPPAGERPALLTHREVETVFHEFGHMLATLLNRVPEPGLRRVVMDFGEVPSQIMQNFVWRRECLDLFGRHYQTGERIPEDVFRRMLAARNFAAAQQQMTQLGIATADLALHTEYDSAREPDPAVYARPIFQRFARAPLPADFSFITGFPHLFAGGYSAGYYSYKWAEVLEADAFSRFEKEGVLSPKIGMEFRTKILERGNSEDAAVLFRDFMGRDPDPGALLRRSGLLQAK